MNTSSSNAVDAALGTALLASMKDKRLDLFQSIIERASIPSDYRDSSGETLLCSSIVHGSLDIATYLIARGDSDVNLPSANKGLPPLSLAILHAQEQICDALIKAGCDVDRPDVDGYTPLHHAVFLSHYEVVRKLLQAGCKVNVRSRRDEMISPLHAACSNGDLAMVKLLLLSNDRDDSGPDSLVDVNLPSSVNLYTALHYAVRQGAIDIAKELIDRGADVLTKSRRGTTPLFLCVTSTSIVRLQMATLLLQHGGGASSSSIRPGSRYRAAPRDAALPLSVVPLHAALYYGVEDMVDLLLAHDDVDLCERGAAPTGPPVWVRPGKDNGTDRRGMSVFLACLSSGRSVQMLDRVIATAQQRGMNPDASGWECLVAAVQWPRHLGKLLDFGLDIGATSHGRTILHEEDCLLRPLSVAALMRLGASATWRTTFEGSTPLHVLAMIGSQSCDLQAILETAAILFDYGADVNACDNVHFSPLMLALELGHLDFAEFLVSCGAKLMHEETRMITWQLDWQATCPHKSAAHPVCADCQPRVQRLLAAAAIEQPYGGKLAWLCCCTLRRHLVACHALPVSEAVQRLGLPARLAGLLLPPQTRHA